MVVPFVVVREVFLVVETMGRFLLEIVFVVGVGLDVVVALFFVVGGVLRFAVVLVVDGVVTFTGVGVGFDVAWLRVDFDVVVVGILMGVDEF